jgi:Alpha/beta hydrolase family
MFFLIPFLDVVLFAVLGIIAGWFAADAVPVAPVLAWLVGIVVALAAFLLLMRWPGQRWRVSQGLADWITARDYMYDQRPDIAARIATFSERLIACVQRSDADEILIVGHSLGATLAVDALAHALATDPDLTRRGPKLAFLTIGATIPKLGLHPEARRLRDCANRVADERELVWGEFQTRQDPISFYRFDPVRLRKFEDNAGGKPHVRVINFRDLLSPETTRRIFWDFMRIHYQFVMASERRGVYDLFTMLIGPAPLERTIWAPGGSAELIGEDGSYLAAAEPASHRATG